MYHLSACTKEAKIPSLCSKSMLGVSYSKIIPLFITITRSAFKMVCTRCWKTKIIISMICFQGQILVWKIWILVSHSSLESKTQPGLVLEAEYVCFCNNYTPFPYKPSKSPLCLHLYFLDFTKEANLLSLLIKLDTESFSATVPSNRTTIWSASKISETRCYKRKGGKSFTQVHKKIVTMSKS